ncbi:MAG TPA: hypothetical protein EYN72_13270 [Dehalococcoidia bacterium]|jgi:hypothetical protein|nr:hypothetical protein [Dehalococcoidia bacterium]HIO72786.1 hypothetical protein [Flavobacteriales bacterium]
MSTNSYKTIALKALLLCLGLIIPINGVGQESNEKKTNYHFKGRISRSVLESYLARSATVASLLHLTLDDDLRMMQNTGVKFAGRVIWMWGGESKIEALIEKGTAFVKRIHKMDPDIILQGAIFEIITTDVNSVPIPASVFEEFNIEAVNRNFDYKKMIYPFGRRVNHWNRGASVPDMSQTETKMWFFYVAKRWIDMGLEAIHFGQVEIMDDRDRKHVHWRDVMASIRSYAKKHARRNFVLCDAHVPSGGIVHNGELMFDLHSFPSRPKSLKGQPHEAILEKGFNDSIYGRSAGGMTPSGWSCESLPYIVEIDNFGNSDHAGQYRESDKFHVWGWDEINWFINQPESYRNKWLKYAYSWVRENDSNGYFQLPLRRFEHYSASMTSPKGQRQEETIKKIWRSLSD